LCTGPSPTVLPARKTIKKVTKACQVHIHNFRVGWYFCTYLKASAFTQGLADSLALSRVASASARPNKCEKCDHLAGPSAPGSQPNRAPRPAHFSSLEQKRSPLSTRFSEGTAENERHVHSSRFSACTAENDHLANFAVGSHGESRWRVCREGWGRMVWSAPAPTVDSMAPLFEGPRPAPT
jgi:hypothetical protein